MIKIFAIILLIIGIILFLFATIKMFIAIKSLRQYSDKGLIEFLTYSVYSLMDMLWYILLIIMSIVIIFISIDIFHISTLHSDPRW